MTDFPIKSAVTVTYDGVGLDPWLTVSDIQRNVGQARTANLTKVGTSNGKKFQYISANESTVKVLADVNYDLATKRRELAGVLTKSEPKQLIFSDEPDKYYMAIVADQSALIEDQFHGEITVTFIVPDGVAHSLTTATVSGQSGTDITVTNAGTAPTSPLLTATMSGDNGVVAWTNDAGGVLQFGANDEIDGVTNQRSELVYHYTFDSAPTGVTLNAGVVAYPNLNGDPNTPNQQTGPFSYTRTPGSASPASMRTADMFWTGPSMSGKLTANSAGKLNGNFQWINRIKFQTSKNTVGRCEFNLTKGTQVVANLTLYDNSLSADMLKFEGKVNGVTLFSDDLPRSYYKNGEYDLVITKLGSQITYRINRVTLGGGGVETRTVAGLDASEIDGWTCWFTGFADDPGWLVGWEDSYFNWVNVDYWQDIPNRFKAGDVVAADIATHTVLLNGAEDPTLDRVGNDWSLFELPAGDSTLRLTASSWATGVTGAVEYREAWY